MFGGVKIFDPRIRVALDYICTAVRGLVIPENNFPVGVGLRKNRINSLSQELRTDVANHDDEHEWFWPQDISLNL